MGESLQEGEGETAHAWGEALSDERYHEGVER